VAGGKIDPRTGKEVIENMKNEDDDDWFFVFEIINLKNHNKNIYQSS
jgi:hypothetical protein